LSSFARFVHFVDPLFAVALLAWIRTAIFRFLVLYKNLSLCAPCLCGAGFPWRSWRLGGRSTMLGGNQEISLILRQQMPCPNPSPPRQAISAALRLCARHKPLLLPLSVYIWVIRGRICFPRFLRLLRLFAAPSAQSVLLSAAFLFTEQESLSVCSVSLWCRFPLALLAPWRSIHYAWWKSGNITDPPAANALSKSVSSPPGDLCGSAALRET
jgi:hypothetical protein